MSPGLQDLSVGERVQVKLPDATATCGTVAYCGGIDGQSGAFYGLVLDDAVGKNDGTVKGKSYFKARPEHGLFVKLGAKNVVLSRMSPPPSPAARVGDTSVTEMQSDLLDGWGESNPFDKSGTGASMADWGSPASGDSNLLSREPSSVNTTGTRIDEWDPDGPVATPMKGGDESSLFGDVKGVLDESLVPVSLLGDLIDNGSETSQPLVPISLLDELQEKKQPFLDESLVPVNLDDTVDLLQLQNVAQQEPPSPIAVVPDEDPFAAVGSSMVEVALSEANVLFGDGPLTPAAANGSVDAVEFALLEAERVMHPVEVASLNAHHEEPAEEVKEERHVKEEAVAPSSLSDGSSPELFAEIAAAVTGESTPDVLEEKTPEVREASPPPPAVAAAASLFGGSDGGNDSDPFASLSNEPPQSASALFGGDEVVDNVFAAATSVTPLAEAAALFGGGVSESTDPFANSSDPFASAVPVHAQSSPAPFKAENGAVMEIPDLFGNVSTDSLFGAPSAPFGASAAAFAPAPAPAPAPAFVAAKPGFGSSHPLVAPKSPGPVKHAVPLPTVKLPVPVAVKAAPTLLTPVSAPMMPSVVVPTSPASHRPAPSVVPSSPVVKQVPMPVPLVPPSPVKSAPVKAAVAPLPTPVFVAPAPVALPVPAKLPGVVVSAPVPAKTVPSFVSPAPPRSVAAVHPAVPVVGAQVVAAHVPSPSPSVFTPPSPAPPVAKAPVFQRSVPKAVPVASVPAPVFPTYTAPGPAAVGMPRVPSAPTFAQHHFQMPPPSPQSSAILTMSDDLVGEESSFVQAGSPAQARVVHVQHPVMEQQRAVHPGPPPVSIRQPQFDSFFPSAYGAPTAVPIASSQPAYAATSTMHLVSHDEGRPPVPIWAWGFGGRSAVMFPRQRRALSSCSDPAAMGGTGALMPGPFKMVSFGKIASAKNADLMLTATFPGPLRSKASKSQVVTWLKSRIAALSHAAALAAPEARVDVEDDMVLWELLSVICEHDGDIRSQGGKESLLSLGQAAIIALLRGANRGDEYAAAVDAQVPPDVSRLAVIEGLLMEGRHVDALREAVQAKLWSHALFLASFSADPEMFQSVRAQFASEACTSGSPLRSLYLMLSGQMASLFSHAVDSSAIAMDKWRESASMILANGSHASYAAALGTLGDGLWSRQGRVFAAHVCYVLAQTPFLPLTDPNARLVLIGGDHKRRPSGFVSSESIQRSEVLEYCRSLANSQYSCPELERYKLVYAANLAELGEIDKAFAYVTSIEESVRSNSNAFRSDVAFVNALREFEERIVGFRPGLRSAASSSIVRSLFGGMLRAVVGSDTPPPQPVASKAMAPAPVKQVAVPTTPVQPLRMSASVPAPAAKVEPPKPSPVAKEEEKSEEEDSGGGGGWGFWPFGKKKAPKEVTLGNKLERYYNEELKKWVRPGEEDQIRAVMNAPPPSDALLRGGSGTVTAPDQRQQFVQPTASPLPLPQTYQQPQLQQQSVVPQPYQQPPSPAVSHMMPPPFGASQNVSAPIPHAAAPVASVPNFSRTAAGGGRSQRRYVDTLNTAPRPATAAAVSMPNLPSFGAPPPAFSTPNATPVSGQYKLFVPAPVALPVAPVQHVEEHVPAPPVAEVAAETVAPQEAAPLPLSAEPPPVAEEQPTVPAAEEEFL